MTELYLITDSLVVVAIVEMASGDNLASPDHLSVLDEDSLQALIDNGEDVTYEEGVL